MGSSSSSASREAQRAEEERRRQIQQTQSRLESIFGSPEREQQIQDFVSDTRGFLETELGREKQDNDRKLKFALARSGHSGGSVDVDQKQDMGEAFLRAVVEANRRAEGAGQRLRMADQDAKFSLFNQALGGLDMTTASSNALRAMRQNIGIAKNEATETNFDRFFSQFADLYSLSRETAARRRASEEFNPLYSPRPQIVNPVSGGGY